MASRIVSDLVTRSVENALDTAARVRAQLKGASRLFNRVVAKTGLPIPPLPDGGRKTWPGEVVPPAPTAKTAPAPAEPAEPAAKAARAARAAKTSPAPARLPASEPAPGGPTKAGGLIVERGGPSLDEWRRARDAAAAAAQAAPAPTDDSPNEAQQDAPPTVGNTPDGTGSSTPDDAVDRPDH